MMQQKSNQRVVYLDLLRVIATFGVIFLHVCAGEFVQFSHSMDWYIATIGDGLVRWSVPVFVMISGALFLNPDRHVSYSEILKKRIPRLLLAYFFWSFIYVLYAFALTGFSDFSVLRFLKRLVSYQLHLWFLPMLMGVYFLIPILRKIAQDKKLMHYTLVLWIVFVFISFLQFTEAFKVMGHFYRLFNMNIVLGYSGYFILGYFLFQQSFSKRQRSWIYVLGVIGALIAIFGTFYISLSKEKEDSLFFSNLSVQIAVMATALFVLVKERSRKTGKMMLRFIDFVRKDLFGVYLTHMLWFNVINTYAFRHCCSEIITLPVITIIVFFLSLFTTKLIRLIPILRKVVE